MSVDFENAVLRKLDNLNTRFDKLEANYDNLNSRFDNLEANYDARFDKLEATNNDLNFKFSDFETNYNDLMARLNAAMGMDSPEKKETERAYATYKNAFWENMHTGVPQNALKESSSSSGGYLVPDSFESRIIDFLENENIVRKVSHSIKTSQNLKIPVAVKNCDAIWVKEGEQHFPTEAEFGEVKIEAYK